MHGGLCLNQFKSSLLNVVCKLFVPRLFLVCSLFVSCLSLVCSLFVLCLFPCLCCSSLRVIHVLCSCVPVMPVMPVMPVFSVMPVRPCPMYCDFLCVFSKINI